MTLALVQPQNDHDILEAALKGDFRSIWKEKYSITFCDQCGVPIIIGSEGDLRNYLYPSPDIFADPLPEMNILCYDCRLHAESEDEAARNGCSQCGEPVKEAKFYGLNGVLCSDCVNSALEWESDC